MAIPQCTPQVPLTPDCAACSCTAGSQCGELITKCDANCWALLGCAYRYNCQGDTTCVINYCPQFLAAAAGIISSVAPCVTACIMPCSWDLQQQSGGDSDAGL